MSFKLTVKPQMISTKFDFTEPPFLTVVMLLHGPPIVLKGSTKDDLIKKYFEKCISEI